MKKTEIDRLIDNVCFKYFHQTVENCIKEWGIELNGKDKNLMYPVMPPLPDTEEEVIKAINSKMP